jgi:(S)-ureidoglycine aminohydrolase
MRAQNQLLHSRARVRERYAVFPLEGIPLSRLPAWTKTEVRILAAPALGAQFVEYLLDIAAEGSGWHKSDGRTETFLYVLSGNVTLMVERVKKQTLTAGSFALLPPSASFTLNANEKSQLLMLKKVYEPAAGIEEFAPLFGNQADVKSDVFCGDEGAQLQLLVPDDLQYDMAMNIFTFDVGHSLPYVETHVMEHGLYFMEGKGLYYLGDEWMEVEATDFIWMGPFCPQSFYATGPVASRYLYYKNVNRDIAL